MGLLDVEEYAAPQDALDAVNLRAVRIVRGFTVDVMLAMNRYPLAGVHSGGKPQPQTEEMRNQRMQVKRVMRLLSMQKNGHRNNRNMGQAQGDQ